MPDIISKLLRAAIWSRCADWFESEQMPFPGAGCISFATDRVQTLVAIDSEWYQTSFPPPAQAVLERSPKSSSIDLAVKTFDCLLE